MIAIIMAVYNGETYLNEQIDSLLSNTEKDFVLHIFDDGSTDRSAVVIHPTQISIRQRSFITAM